MIKFRGEIEKAVRNNVVQLVLGFALPPRSNLSGANVFEVLILKLCTQLQKTSFKTILS